MTDGDLECIYAIPYKSGLFIQWQDRAFVYSLHKNFNGKISACKVRYSKRHPTPSSMNIIVHVNVNKGLIIIIIINYRHKLHFRFLFNVTIYNHQLLLFLVYVFIYTSEHIHKYICLICIYNIYRKLY